VEEARAVLEGYRKDARRRFDLTPVFVELDELRQALRDLHRHIGATPLSAGAVSLVNGCLMSLGRELIPIAYCRAERFEHDSTQSVPPFPGLEPVRQLGRLGAKSDEARRLAVGLVRQRNKVCYHLGCATIAVQATLAALPAPRRKPRKR
jgi:hypothetical protein